MTREQLAIRLDPDLSERAQALVALMDERPEYKTLRLTRASVLRMAIFEGLQVLESRFGKAAKPRSRSRKSRVGR